MINNVIIIPPYRTNLSDLLRLSIIRINVFERPSEFVTLSIFVLMNFNAEFCSFKFVSVCSPCAIILSSSEIVK